jgi:hypothetical protein
MSSKTPSTPATNRAGGRLVLRSWTSRFPEQSSALIWKNVLVNLRNLQSTLLRLLSPL